MERIDLCSCSSTSIGPLQISHAYHQDAWGLPKGGKGSERRWFSRCQGVEYSESTCVRFWIRYVPWALLFGDVETLARAHNGGPKYHKAMKTARYWKKVKKAMDSYDFSENPRRRRTQAFASQPLAPATLFAAPLFSLGDLTSQT